MKGTVNLELEYICFLCEAINRRQRVGEITKTEGLSKAGFSGREKKNKESGKEMGGHYEVTLTIV